MDSGMRNAQIAEWILSLVTTPERAASTVGDLMESAPSRGRFWLGVLRTGVSLLWREVAVDPARMIGLAVRGTLLEIVMFMAFVILAAFLGGIVGAVWYAAGIAGASHPITMAIGWVLAGAIGCVLIPFQIGRWLARRAPGRELAPGLAQSILSAVFTLMAAGFVGTNVFETVLSVMLGPIPMFAGAVWVRRKRLSR